MRKTVVPTLPLTGGCQCGKLRYRLTGRPIMFYLCHCTECQRHTSSAFGESLRMRSADVAFTGEQAVATWISDAGNKREGRFCPSCGVRVWHGAAGADTGNIKAGTLDDTSWLVPAGHIWTRSKQPFMAVAADELDYAKQPDDGYEELKRRWAEMTA